MALASVQRFLLILTSLQRSQMGSIKKEVNAEFDDQPCDQYDLAQLEGRVKGEYVDQQEER